MTEQRDELIGALRRLAEIPRPVMPKDELRRRIEATLASDGHTERPAFRGRSRTAGRAIRLALSAAAGVALFVAGAAYGRSTAPPSAGTVAPDVWAPAVSERAAYRIQRAGSEYIAAVAALSRPSVDPAREEYDTARQVALGVFYGAAAELMRAAPEDPISRSVYMHLARQRESRAAASGF